MHNDVEKYVETVVALLAEGVDRNTEHGFIMGLAVVALLAEGVDRNNYDTGNIPRKSASPSSRRAWIEI